MRLVETVYRETTNFPRAETFCLTNQVRRAAISIPSNLAEGAGRNSRREWVHFLGIACGSLAELETQLELAVRLGYLNADAEALDQTNHVGKLIRSLRKTLLAKPAT